MPQNVKRKRAKFVNLNEIIDNSPFHVYNLLPPLCIVFYPNLYAAATNSLSKSKCSSPLAFQIINK